MILGSVQPSYLAWIPLFERMKQSDIFVYLDDVKYSKNSFHNRNRIKTAQGDLTLTVPVLYKGNSQAFINQIKIDYRQNWNIKHWKSIEINYKKAKYFEIIAADINTILHKSWDNLADLNISLIEFFRKFLGITTKCYRSSEIAIPGEGNEKLVNLCKKLGASHFVVKPNTEDYHPKEYFQERGIEFSYLMGKNQIYQQLYGDFIGGLSILDYAMNCGPNSFKKDI